MEEQQDNWRYQLIGVERDGHLEYGVYEVAFDKATNEVTHILACEPIQLITDGTPKDMLRLVKTIYRDLKSQTKIKIQQSIRQDEVFEQAVHEEEVEESISIYHGDNETERFAVEKMYDDRDEDDNVIDAVDFFNRKG